MLHEDAELVAVNKPSGIFTHPTALSPERYTVMLALRQRYGERVYPLHRLDRATSGVLLFARSSSAAAAFSDIFADAETRKLYWAVVRGWPEDAGVVERALRREGREALQSALTRYRTLRRAEWAAPVGAFPRARFAWVEAMPVTGRRHQIRRHLRGIDHPIINDSSHGDGRQNSYFRSHFGIQRLLLHAVGLEFRDPRDGSLRRIAAPLEEAMAEVWERFKWPLRRDPFGPDPLPPA